MKRPVVAGNNVAKPRRIDHPYHPLGQSKSDRIGAAYALAGKPFAEARDIDHWLAVIGAGTRVPVRSNAPMPKRRAAP